MSNAASSPEDDLHWLFSLARRLARDDDAARDLVQEAFEKAASKPPRDPAKRRSWLAGIVRRLAFTRRRGVARRRRREGQALLHAPTSAPDTEAARREIFATLQTLLQQLPAEQREVVLRIYFLGHSAAEIARDAGRPEATIRSWHHRALAHLRSELDRRDEDRGAWRAVIVGAPRYATASRPAETSLASTALGALVLTTAVAATVLGVPHMSIGAADAADVSMVGGGDDTSDMSPEPRSIVEKADSGPRVDEASHTHRGSDAPDPNQAEARAPASTGASARDPAAPPQKPRVVPRAGGAGSVPACPARGVVECDVWSFERYGHKVHHERFARPDRQAFAGCRRELERCCAQADRCWGLLACEGAGRRFHEYYNETCGFGR